jgi:hypothetical protein
MLDRPHVQRILDRLVQTLSEDIAGEFYRDEPTSDDLNLLDEELRLGVRAMLLELDLPEQALRGEAAVHAAADRDADRRVA